MGKPYTVIIPTFNNRRIKQGCLTAVLTALLPWRDVIEQVIVVDNASTDGGPGDLLASTRDLPVTLTSCPRENCRAATRNTGVRLARSPFVVFLDDDILLTDGILRTLVSELREDVFFTAARMRYLPLRTPPEDVLAAARTRRLASLVEQATPWPGAQVRPAAQTAASVYAHVTTFGVVPRELLQRVDGFDERMIGWGREDNELTSRLLEGATLRNLLHRTTVLHVDHYVSPYLLHECEGNTRLYQRSQAERRQPLDDNGLYRRLAAGLDIAPIPTLARKPPLEPVSLSAIRAMGLSSHAASRLVARIEAARRHAGASRVVTAIAAQPPGVPTPAAPQRLQLFMVCEESDPAFLEDHDPTDGSNLLFHFLPAGCLLQLARWPLYPPDVWLFEAGRWMHAAILLDSHGRLRQAREQLAAANAERTAYALTFMLGQLDQWAACASENGGQDNGLRLRAARCEQCVRLLADARFPRDDRDGLTPEDEQRPRSVVEIRQSVERLIADAFAAPPAELASVAILSPLNALGLLRLVEIAPPWRRLLDKHQLHGAAHRDRTPSARRAAGQPTGR